MPSKLFLYLLINILLLPACRSSRDVVSDAWLQKRKYTKGFHIRHPKQKVPEFKEMPARIFESANNVPLVDSLKAFEPVLLRGIPSSAKKNASINHTIASEKSFFPPLLSSKTLIKDADFRELYSQLNTPKKEPEFIFKNPGDKSFFLLEVSGAFALAALLWFYIGFFVFLGSFPLNFIILGIGLLGLCLVFYVFALFYALVDLRQSFAEVKNGGWTKRKENAVFMVLVLLFYPLLALIIYAISQFLVLP